VRYFHTYIWVRVLVRVRVKGEFVGVALLLILTKLQDYSSYLFNTWREEPLLPALDQPEKIVGCADSLHKPESSGLQKF